MRVNKRLRVKVWQLLTKATAQRALPREMAHLKMVSCSVCLNLLQLIGCSRRSPE